MERTVWSDERLEDFRQSVDSRFDRVDGRLDRIDTDIRELRATMIHVGAGVAGVITTGLLGVIAALIAQG